MKIFVVMSTNPNESAYEVHSAHKSKKEARKAIEILMEEELESNPDSELEIWSEELELQE